MKLLLLTLWLSLTAHIAFAHSTAPNQATTFENNISSSFAILDNEPQSSYITPAKWISQLTPEEVCKAECSYDDGDGYDKACYIRCLQLKSDLEFF